MRTYLKKRFRKIFRKWILYFKKVNLGQRLLDSIIMAIVAGIVSSTIINIANNSQIEVTAKAKLLDNLSWLSIGCNKEWMNDAFGNPVFKNSDNLTEEYVYITSIALIRAFFSPNDDSCKMFFVTRTTDEYLPFTPNLTSIFKCNTGKNQMLGTITFDQIKDGELYLFDVIGYFQNGSGRSFYGEGYSPFYIYRNVVYFASVDYGVPSSLNLMGDIYMGPLKEEEKVYYKEFLASWIKDLDVLTQTPILHERSKFYPNTYGMSALSGDYTMEKLADYDTFNSADLTYRY